MFMTAYSLRHMIRSRAQSLAVLLTVLALMLLQIGLWETAEQKKNEVERLYNEYPIECRISSTTKVRTETLAMREHYLTVCTGEDGELTPYIKDVAYKNSILYRAPYAATAMGYRVGFPAARDPHSVMGASENQSYSYLYGADIPVNSLVGLNRFTATEKLDESNISGVTFIEGYGEADFLGSEQICILHREYMEEMGLKAGDMLTLELLESAVLLDDIAFEPQEMSFRIVGVIEGGGGAEVYCPFTVVSDTVKAWGHRICLESLSFTVKNNRLLNETKMAAAKYFTVVERVPEYNSEKYSLTVYDGAFFQTLKTLLRDVRLYDLLLPVCFAVSFLTAFLVSFLTTRSRRTEAVMLRSIGVSGPKLFYALFIEQVILCFLAALAGWGADMIFGQGIRPVYPLIFVACCLTGCLISCIATLNTNILTGIKGRE